MCLRWLTVGLCAAFVAAMAGEASFAADYGAITRGNWNSTSTWTPASIPGALDNVFIGGNYPTGSAAAGTVTLTQDQYANDVYLGYGSG